MPFAHMYIYVRVCTYIYMCVYVLRTYVYTLNLNINSILAESASYVHNIHLHYHAALYNTFIIGYISQLL